MTVYGFQVVASFGGHCPLVWSDRTDRARLYGVAAGLLKIGLLTAVLMTGGEVMAGEVTGQGPNFKPGLRLTQQQIVQGKVTLKQIRKAGLVVFSTPFNKLDGFGDGPFEPGVDQRDPLAGNRPTLQGNGTFLRVNGLDAQACLECHSVVSSRTVPATFGVGGHGGINNSAMLMPDQIDVAGVAGEEGQAVYNGRVINPPFLFGAGGVELLAREMTQQLQVLKQQARETPDSDIALISKGVSFGVLRFEKGAFDYSAVEGVDEDLVVRPFGRKGNVASLREFDIGAMAFHMGMQAVEALDSGSMLDDNDGITNEITRGDLSALSIFQATLEPPVQKQTPKAGRLQQEGARIFRHSGCSDCHRPVLHTSRTHLPFKLTGAPELPFSDTFYEIDLTQAPMHFHRNRQGGVEVRLFSDLKRHNMGPSMAENFELASEQQNEEFITARLWGVADSAPYMHDGRAQTLSEAISMHGGDGEYAAERFTRLNDDEKEMLLSFLMSLRTPQKPAKDLMAR